VTAKIKGLYKLPINEISSSKALGFTLRETLNFPVGTEESFEQCKEYNQTPN
jgi:hypothetical protein